MTALEKVVYESIIEFYENNEIQPTIREIREMTGIRSNETVKRCIDGLAEQGYLKRLQFNRMRNYELVATDKIKKNQALIKLKHFEEIVAQDTEFSNDFRTRFNIIATTEKAKLM